MKKMTPISAFVNLILQLTDSLAKSQTVHFVFLILGFACDSSGHITGALLVVGEGFRHFSNHYRFLRESPWSVEMIFKALVRLLIRIFSPGEVVIAIDDTSVYKSGKNIFGTAFHHGHTNKPNRPKYFYGHVNVTASWLEHCPILNRLLSLPLGSKLYRRENGVKKTQLAWELLEWVLDVVNVPVIAVVDCIYAKGDILRKCIAHAVTVVGGLQSNAVLYRQPPKKRKKGRGRPKKYGGRMKSLPKRARDKKKFRKIVIKAYGRKRKVFVYDFVGIWKPAGQMIKVVITWWPRAKKPTYFFCTDTRRSAKWILERAADRWGIEQNFRELKEHGFGAHQCRAKNSVERAVNISCWSYTLSWLAVREMTVAGQKIPMFKPAWYPHKKRISYNDIVRLLWGAVSVIDFSAVFRKLGKVLKNKDTNLTANSLDFVFKKY